MKIRNFKINQKAVSKLAACVLVGTLAATTLTGCGRNDKNNFLEGTILEDTCVVTFEDGAKDIAVTLTDCIVDTNTGKYYHHYRSVISGECFASEKCISKSTNSPAFRYYGITNEESITRYLTPNEIAKAMQGELDNNDIIAIVRRTMEPTTEETNEKTR